MIRDELIFLMGYFFAGWIALIIMTCGRLFRQNVLSLSEYYYSLSSILFLGLFLVGIIYIFRKQELKENKTWK